MQGQNVHIVSQTIRYIEDHLHEKPDLDMAADALHYSKYYLHRIFTKTVGLTIHAYVKRRQLTEAAKLLVFSKKPIIEIALMSGYESQQAFTDSFKAMYKTAPAEFREAEEFYPLQLEIHLKKEVIKMDFTKDDIRYAVPADVNDWMELVDLTIDGYPCMDREKYMENLHQYISDKKALILWDGRLAIGIMGFSTDSGNIDFFAVHPQYRNLGITKLFVDKLADELLYGREITLTTYRAGDRADTGYRKEYCSLGFSERELLVEYGYPTQRLVLLPGSRIGEADLERGDQNAADRREGALPFENKEEVSHDEPTKESVSEKF